MGNIAIVMLVIVAVILVAVLAIAFARQRSGRTSAAAAPVAEPSRSTIAPPAPMTGLEAALDQAMDRSGRNMRDKLEAEAAIVDGLKVADDTGPVLRRALDRVEHTGEPGHEAPPAG